MTGMRPKSVSGKAWPLPTAHTSRADTASTPDRPYWRFGAAGGLTGAQSAPVQCVISGCSESVHPLPTAQTSAGDTAATSKSAGELMSAGTGGAGVTGVHGVSAAAALAGTAAATSATARM